MNNFSQYLNEERALVGAPISSKKKALQTISELVANSIEQCEDRVLFELLVERERLGSTGFGNGVAIPHCRYDGLTAPVICVLQLENGIDFEASDQQKVDLIVALVVPKDADSSHLEVLAQIAERLDKEALLNHLRNAKNVEDLLTLLSD